MDPVMMMRAIERIIDALIGGFSVYLGYRLFLVVPQQANSEGRFQLHKGTAIYLTRVGPGIFFALFGAAVIFTSLYRGVTVGPDYVAGFGGSPVAANSDDRYGRGQQASTTLKAEIAKDIVALNHLPLALRSDLRADQRSDILIAVPRIKLALMKPVWDQGWGDMASFEDWALNGAIGAAPLGTAQAEEFFKQGDGSSRP
jgi:hypothetical protein